VKFRVVVIVIAMIAAVSFATAERKCVTKTVTINRSTIEPATGSGTGSGGPLGDDPRRKVASGDAFVTKCSRHYWWD
jgi:hypothetical protein